jgi:hypothetical protein
VDRRMWNRWSASMVGMSVEVWNSMMCSTNLVETAYEHNLQAAKLQRQVDQGTLKPSSKSYPKPAQLATWEDDGDELAPGPGTSLSTKLAMTRVLAHMRRDPSIMSNHASSQGGYITQIDVCRAVFLHSVRLGDGAIGNMSSFTLEALLAVWPAHMVIVLLMIVFIMRLGCRPEVLATLRWRDLGLKVRLLMVCRSCAPAKSCTHVRGAQVDSNGTMSINPTYSCSSSKRSASAAMGKSEGLAHQGTKQASPRCTFDKFKASRCEECVQHGFFVSNLCTKV